MIEFDRVSKVYPGQVVAIEETSFEIKEGEFVCFIGRSGSGKTTALRMINRMHDPSSGQILINGKATTSMNAVELRRQIGYVIQQIGLMPHMTIYDNIVTVPRLLGTSENECQRLAKELINRVELDEDYLKRYPAELSGGQQQRIGVIRALAANPKIVLMDEPFGALDPLTRTSLQHLVKDLQKETKATFVFVTHDMDEALELADRIAIWHHGKLIQYDTPENIIQSPANDYVRQFLGEDRVLQAKTHALKVKEIMNPNPLTITPNKTLQAALKSMRDNRVDSLFVIDDNQRLLGRIAVQDITNANSISQSVNEVMNRDIPLVKENMLLQNILQPILKGAQVNVPVVNDRGQLTGLVTRTSLVNLVYETVWGDDPEALLDKLDQGGD
ncbi:ABC transporter ATP-binding protein [Hutsoniella sourekii]|uniref:ABC transporter ATP-binding protein n=1 Tax=Hutsoniella sourekii TaxID=87650 RepID=UPI0004832579|nr:ABC transporter ATP-binding protein [Hutsoniella sourekii]